MVIAKFDSTTLLNIGTFYKYIDEKHTYLALMIELEEKSKVLTYEDRVDVFYMLAEAFYL
jgi:hypothetical protein